MLFYLSIILSLETGILDRRNNWPTVNPICFVFPLSKLLSHGGEKIRKRKGNAMYLPLKGWRKT